MKLIYSHFIISYVYNDSNNEHEDDGKVAYPDEKKKNKLRPVLVEDDDQRV